MEATASERNIQRGASEIFKLLPYGHGSAVIDDVLDDRHEASEKTRNRLSSRIRKLRVKGFRDANRAPLDRLADAVRDAVDDGDDALAEAVLATWMETQPELREAAAAHLQQRGIEVLDPPGIRFTGSWDTGKWQIERTRMLDDMPELDADPDDAALMLSLVSGRFPGPPPIESELFNSMIDQLFKLPATAPEWSTEAINLAKWIHYIRAEKLAEVIRITAREIIERKKRIESKFRNDLAYLGIDTVTLGGAPTTPEAMPTALLATLTHLSALEMKLEAYSPLRPQAASRENEIERAEARRAAEEGILTLTRNWESALKAAEKAQQSDDDADGEHAVEEDEAPSGAPSDADPPAGGPDAGEHERILAELREENRRLRQNNRELRAGSAGRDAEVSALNDEIARSRRTEEQWRRAYVESRKGRRPDEDPVRIDSVRDAIALAREAFPDRLLIKLNSRSNEDTPFARPAEVYDALAWLATAHRSESDWRIGETCSGWSCKTDQVEESIARYREWYETLADSKTWFLGAHIGKGTSRDPQHTIRIGFARDDENDRIIVGFIGLHQRNRQS